MDKLDIALLNQRGGIKKTTMSKERIALLKIARIVKSRDYGDPTWDIKALKQILVEVGVLSGKA